MVVNLKRGVESPGNLWLARALFDLHAIEFGDFTLGRTTVHSPVYVNPRLLISSPNVLRRTARVMEQEIRAEQARLQPKVRPFDLVAGVPFGGLHLATAYSLRTGIPVVYAHPKGEEGSRRTVVEGQFTPGQTVLIIDDLMTTGGSILETAKVLEENGLRVRDSFVLIDRGQGGDRRLRREGYHVISLLNLRVMLTYYMSTGRISQEDYDKSLAYLEQNQAL
jgi:orotate phosphoribosyltransferase/uridine monophosphate synthetase